MAIDFIYISLVDDRKLQNAEIAMNALFMW